MAPTGFTPLRWPISRPERSSDVYPGHSFHPLPAAAPASAAHADADAESRAVGIRVAVAVAVGVAAVGIRVAAVVGIRTVVGARRWAAGHRGLHGVVVFVRAHIPEGLRGA